MSTTTPPNDPSTTVRPDATPSESKRSESIQQRVLIVDDEETFRNYLDRFLDRAGFIVRTAETGREAIEIAREFRPDLLLADWMLRCEMHGIEVGEALRADHKTLRILLMTGFPTADLEAEAARVGINGFLEKPFSLDDLAAEVGKALDLPPHLTAPPAV